ncbi:hypothetical protein PIB30_084164 [Stylosanthes scabra]|uniref:Uncharacterized protein n=1 Tax=Stylosanthes scabra TaxID=79078 RepID=A0ABU6WS97_9FABA|nr:hypothetical protein [Stylosanthes scabra]
MQKSQANYMEEVKQIKEKQEEMWNNHNRFQSQFLQEQERLAREIQEVRKSQISQTLVNNKRLETEKNLQQAVERKRKTNVLWMPQIILWGKHFLPSRSTRAGAFADCTSDSRFPTTTSSS